MFLALFEVLNMHVMGCGIIQASIARATLKVAVLFPKTSTADEDPYLRPGIRSVHAARLIVHTSCTLAMPAAWSPIESPHIP
jgi:hypothetical protein